MLPHQFSAFTEGLFGPLHSEFERTPKAATIIGPYNNGSTSASPSLPRRQRATVKIHGPYVAAELFFVVHQIVWTTLFARQGLWACAVGSGALAACVLGLAYFYGDHLHKRLFILERR